MLMNREQIFAEIDCIVLDCTVISVYICCGQKNDQKSRCREYLVVHLHVKKAGVCLVVFNLLF